MQQYFSSLHTQESFFFFIGISNLFLLFINFGILFVCHWKVHFLPLLTKEFARYLPGNNLTSFVCCKEILQTFCLKKNMDIIRQIHFLSRLISCRDKHTLNPFYQKEKTFLEKNLFFSEIQTLLSGNIPFFSLKHLINLSKDSVKTFIVLKHQMIL